MRGCPAENAQQLRPVSAVIVALISTISVVQQAAQAAPRPLHALIVFAFRYENPEPEPAAPEPVVDPKAKKK